MNVTRRAFRLGLLASAFGLIARASAWAADALAIDKEGDVSIPKRLSVGKTVDFAIQEGPKLNFLGDQYSIGMQPGTLYARAANFVWYAGGKHVAALDPGEGGKTMMSLEHTSGLTVRESAIFKMGLTVDEAATFKKNIQVSGDSLAPGTNMLDVRAAKRTEAAPAPPATWKGIHPTGLALYVTAESRRNGNLVEFRHSNGSQGIGFGYDTIYATGSLPDQGLRLQAKGQGRIQIVSEDEKELFVAGGDEALRILRGIINSDGTIFQGKGFTVRAHDGGFYNIDFTPPFSSVPSVTVTQITPDSNYDTRDGAIIPYIGAGSMQVKTGKSNGESEPRKFSFIVVGERNW